MVQSEKCSIGYAVVVRLSSILEKDCTWSIEKLEMIPSAKMLDWRCGSGEVLVDSYCILAVVV
jgi:hypothetical protein